VPVRNPSAVRPWQHVLEPLGGYLRLAAKMLTSNDPAWCEAWNFGPIPGQELPVSQLADMFISTWQSGSWQDKSDPQRPHEAHVLRLSIDKALHRLGWRPKWDSGEAIARAARWYRRFYDSPNGSMRGACCEDIEAYETAGATP
jgi:CDP-glucose 4,6-dehydratase